MSEGMETPIFYMYVLTKKIPNQERWDFSVRNTDVELIFLQFPFQR